MRLPDPLLRYATRHAGKTAGTFLGFLTGLGVFGAALGLLIGFFYDELSRERRILRACRAVYSAAGPGDIPPFAETRWVKTATAVALAASVLSEGVGSDAAGDGDGTRRTVGVTLVEREVLKRRLVEHCGFTGREAHLLRMMVDAFFTDRRVSVGALADIHRALGEPEEQTGLLRLLVATAPGERGRLSASQYGLVKSLSLNLGVDAAAYNRMMNEVVGIDEEAYALLGTAPDAPTAEVKRVYHRLAAQFHPDHAASLSREQLEQTEEAFLRIKSAYQRIMEERESRR